MSSEKEKAIIRVGNDKISVKVGDIDASDAFKQMSNLNEQDFKKFCSYFMRYYCRDEHLFRPCDSVEGAFFYLGDVFKQIIDLTIVDYIPHELFIYPWDVPYDNPFIRRKIELLKKEFFLDKNNSYLARFSGISPPASINKLSFITNFVGSRAEQIFFNEEHHDFASKAYLKIIEEMEFDKEVGYNVDVKLGSPYIFVVNAPKQSQMALECLKKEVLSQFAIEFSPETGYEVNEVQQGKYISSGVGRLSHNIYLPQIILPHKNKVAEALQRLLNSNPSEKALQDFFIANYKIIFNGRYDRIESELALRFPESDINNQNRRIDLFAHDIINNDWDLIEFKKITKLTGMYRGVPILSQEISGAIMQLRNYADLLKQDKVKDFFKKDGIEYYQPSLKLIVGGDANVSHKQWRNLIAEKAAENKVRLITYEDVIAEIKSRYI